MSDKKTNTKLADQLAAMARMDAAVADTPPVTAGATALPPSPTAPPARAAKPAKPAAKPKPAATVGLMKTTVNLVGPSADALQRLQVALMTAAGGTVTASAVVSVALEYAADQLGSDTPQLVDLLAGVRQLDGRRRSRD